MPVPDPSAATIPSSSKLRSLPRERRNRTPSSLDVRDRDGGIRRRTKMRERPRAFAVRRKRRGAACVEAARTVVPKHQELSRAELTDQKENLGHGVVVEIGDADFCFVARRLEHDRALRGELGSLSRVDAGGVDHATTGRVGCDEDELVEIVAVEIARAHARSERNLVAWTAERHGFGLESPADGLGRVTATRRGLARATCETRWSSNTDREGASCRAASRPSVPIR